ncbi:MAG TPA: hypothetical protein VKV24_02825 [Casimicrobiaceae bacterium]|nr:hypothetical protein [Casimicrobiaceae bacterium]
MSVDVLPAWARLIAARDADDDDDDEAPIGDPPDDDEDSDDEDDDDEDDDDEEPLQVAFCIAASPPAPRRGTMSRRTRLKALPGARQADSHALTTVN